MRTNLSEELKIGTDISLNDGSEMKEVEEKEKEKYEKEVQKDLDQKIDAAEEIREAEAPEVELNDAKGKALKIKNFTEKLTLDESDSRILTEDLEDEMFEQRSICVSKVYNALADYANFLYYDAGIEDEDFNIFNELETVCEEAVIRAEDGEWV